MNAHLLQESLGWMAAGAFAASYLARRQNTLRAVQAAAAILWIGYGVATGSLPVIVSNTAVAFMAVVYPLIRQTVERSSEPSAFADESDLKAPPYEELPHIQ